MLKNVDFHSFSLFRFSKSGRVSYAILISSQEKTFIFFHPKMKSKNLFLTSLTLQSKERKKSPLHSTGFLKFKPGDVLL
ncbi:hypothetical protein RN22_24420, partial [Grimontia sp. AD028]